MKHLLYPFRFDAILKEKIWGGNRLRTYLGKSDEAITYGESWEIANLPEGQSVVSNGYHKGKTLEELLSAFAKAILGTSVLERFGPQFPLLIKFIDAAADLSVQLHPNDAIAEKEHKGKGKTEMWYIVHADPGAQIIVGFKEEMTPDLFDKAVASERIHEHLEYIDVKEGDAFYISAGLIHAIGKGIVLAEIQQTSDITYRVFDYNRKQADGSYRDLHIEAAKKAISYTSPINAVLEYDRDTEGNQVLKHSDYFKTDIVKLSERNYQVSREDSFTIIMMIYGDAVLQYDDTEEEMQLGDTFLIPASCKTVAIAGKDAKFLEVYL